MKNKRGQFESVLLAIMFPSALVSEIPRFLAFITELLITKEFLTLGEATREIPALNPTILQFLIVTFS